MIAWHGLARTGRDMDDIAAHLAQRWRVICPDTIGRGLSQWSPLPQQEYCLAFYAQLAASLLDPLAIGPVATTTSTIWPASSERFSTPRT